jgi:hypothetical protein
MTDVVPVMLLVGAIAGTISFGIVQSLVRIFPRGREPVQVRRIDSRTPRMRTATLP